MKDYFTVTELAEHFGVHAKTIYGRLCAKDLKPGQLKRGHSNAVSSQQLTTFSGNPR